MPLRKRRDQAMERMTCSRPFARPAGFVIHVARIPAAPLIPSFPIQSVFDLTVYVAAPQRFAATKRLEIIAGLRANCRAVAR